MPHRAPDPPLREDVRQLGELLGRVLEAHEGHELFALVERVRTLAKLGRQGGAEQGGALRELLASIPAGQALPLSRAFAHFLGLANVAEQHHRSRRYGAGEPVLQTAIASALQAGKTRDDVLAALGRTSIELVLTAHPTQVVRRTVRIQHRAIDDDLTARDRSTGAARDAVREDLARRVALLWHMDEVRKRQPTAMDEVRGAIVLFEQVLWDAVPKFLRTVDRALQSSIQATLPADSIPVRFGSWVGGDRDGNPLVTAAVTREASLRARWTAARLWHGTLSALRDELAVVAATDALRTRARGEREPYRVVLPDLLERLAITERWCDEAMAASGRPLLQAPTNALLDATELIAELDACDTSLRAVGLGVIADGQLLDARRRARCFGLVLCPIDVRQESGVHASVLDKVTRALGLGSYLSWSEDERVAFLRRELASRRPLLPREPIDDPEVAEAFATLDVIAHGGPGAFGAYVISMAKAPSDALAVLLLQREARIEPPLRVVPLFETLDDLGRAEAVMKALLDDEAFAAHAGPRVEVMVGYSDSTKDAGRLGSAWAIHRALEGVSQVLQAKGVEPVFFHGRGGTVGRGGGPIRDSILSLPRGTLHGRVRVTVQGESIDSNLGLQSLAVESLDLYTSSVVEALLVPAPPAPAPFRAEMDRLAQEATQSYRAIVHDDPKFVPYFRAATPERELSLIHAGSRPARRKPSSDVASLRAIPWVFAWNQVRLLLPSWLGLGEALSAALADPDRADRIKHMAREWPFFRSLVGLVSMSLSKADATIFRIYEEQLVPAELRPLGKDLCDRLEMTTRAILQVVDKDELLGDEPQLQASVALRNPYIDPLNILQAELLRRLRAGTEDESVVEALLVTINGIAAGLRNTG